MSAEAHHLSDEDDFADHEGLDDREGVGQGVGGDVILFQQQPGVGRDGAEEKGQVGGDDGVVFELVFDAVLETRCGWCCGGG